MAGIATSVCGKDVKYTGTAQRAFDGKIPHGHLLFTGIIMAGVLMFCNFKSEDVVSLKLDGRLSQLALPFYSRVIT